MSRASRQLRLTYVDDGLSPSRLEVLAVISRRGSLWPSELAIDEGLDRTMLSRIVAKLEAAGLARRTPDEPDGQVVRLGVTDAGRALYEVIRSGRTGALLSAWGLLAPLEQRKFGGAIPVLETVVGVLEQRNR